MMPCFEQNKKNIKIFQLKIAISTAVKNCTILHGRVCVMKFQQETDYDYTFKVPYF